MKQFSYCSSNVVTAEISINKSVKYREDNCGTNYEKFCYLIKFCNFWHLTGNGELGIQTGDQLVSHMVHYCSESEVTGSRWRAWGHVPVSDIFTTGHLHIVGGNLMDSLENNIHNIIMGIHMIAHEEYTGTHTGT